MKHQKIKIKCEECGKTFEVKRFLEIINPKIERKKWLEEEMIEWTIQIMKETQG